MDDHDLDRETGAPAKGRVLQDAIFAEWLLEGDEERSTLRVPFLNPDGQPMFERHEVNKERGMNLTTLEKYTASVKERRHGTKTQHSGPSSFTDDAIDAFGRIVAVVASMARTSVMCCMHP